MLTVFQGKTSTFIFRQLALLGLFIVYNYAFKKIGYLEDDAFFNQFLISSAFQSLGLVVSIVLPALFLSGLFYTRLGARWHDIEDGIVLRDFILLLSIVLAISYAFQGYNYYFLQGYYFDRFLLLIFAVLVYWRPVFVFMFLLVLFPLIWQLSSPIGGHIWGTNYHVIQALLLFSAWFTLNRLHKPYAVADYLFMLSCMIAAVYWTPGWLKWNLDWSSIDKIAYMPLAAYAHGWLKFLNPQQIVAYTNLIGPFETVLHVIVLGFELGALVSLWKRKLFLGLLIVASVFHIGVFVFYGYMLWAWLIVDIGLFVLIFKTRATDDFFSFPAFLLSVFLILSASLWLKPPRLAWINTPLSYTYQYQVVGESGQKYQLNPRFFSPYGDNFTMANFHYLSKTAYLVGSYGITSNGKIAVALQSVKTAEDIFSLEESMGKRVFDADRAAVFYDFINDYLKNYNKLHFKEQTTWFLDCCSSPPHFWSLDMAQPYNGQEEISQIHIFEATTLFSQGKLEQIRRTLIKTIDID